MLKTFKTLTEYTRLLEKINKLKELVSKLESKGFEIEIKEVYKTNVKETLFEVKLTVNERRSKARALFSNKESNHNAFHVEKTFDEVIALLADQLNSFNETTSFVFQQIDKEERNRLSEILTSDKEFKGFFVSFDNRTIRTMPDPTTDKAQFLDMIKALLFVEKELYFDIHFHKELSIGINFNKAVLQMNSKEVMQWYEKQTDDLLLKVKSLKVKDVV